MFPLAGHPRFLSLEGLDGSGKTTQVEGLEAEFRARGLATVRLREPGGTALSDGIRSLLLSPAHAVAPKAELLLYSAARAQLVQEAVAPALAAGKVVLADRFGWSSLAYQGYGRGLDLAMVESLLAMACGPVWPAHSFLLDLPVEDLAARLRQAGREPDRMERAGEDFFRRVRAGYLELARRHPSHFTVLDAREPAAALRARIAAKALDLVAAP